MKINFNAPLLDEDGKQANIGTKEAPAFRTLGWLAAQALLASYPSESPSGEEKHKRYRLWSRIKDGGEVDITIEEAGLIKNLIGLGATPLACGQAWDLLEGSA